MSNAISFTSPAALASMETVPQVSANGLSMDSVLAMISMKYSSLTTAFHDAMQDEKARQAKLELVNKAKEALQPFCGRDLDPNYNTPEQQAGRDAAEAAAGYLRQAGYPESDPTLHKLETINAKSDVIKASDTDDANKGLADLESNLTGDSQMNMLQLQDTMSKIQTLTSMATNLESTIHDMQKGIVNNLHV
jgi:hypothetical protein